MPRDRQMSTTVPTDAAQASGPPWVQALQRWYAGHRRALPWRARPTPYRVWVSEIMLQQTQVTTAIPYFRRFLRAFPSFRALAQADLQAVLKLYYPQAQAFIDDWAKPTAWDFVIRYPDQDCFRRAQKKSLTGFLKIHRIGISLQWEQRIERRKDAAWHVDQAVGAAKRLLAVSLAKQLIRLEATLNTYRKRIMELFREHPDAGIFQSLPGAGEKLAPRLLASMGKDRERFDSAQGPQQLSGVVPVSSQTGGRKKQPTVVCRHAVDHNFRTTMHLFAWCSTNYCT